jgi:hypothetical protein
MGEDGQQIMKDTMIDVYLLDNNAEVGVQVQKVK